MGSERVQDLSENEAAGPPRLCSRLALPTLVVASLSSQRQSNASQTLCDIIRLGREQGGQLQEAAEPDPLLAVLES